MTSRTRISRRQFVRAAAAVPVVAWAGSGGGAFAASHPRIVVIGAGAFGGWTALALRRRGAEVILADAWGPGNPRSSSGGETRVIRAVYGADRIYVEMVKRSYEMWEALERSSGAQLYVETGALWMHRGGDDYVRSAEPTMKEFGFPLEKIEISDARRNWPQIGFEGVKSIWMERRAGALSARRACAFVRDELAAAGGSYRTAQLEPGPMASESMAWVRASDGTKLEADAFVFACGPWLGKLFPDALDGFIRPTRQEVHYFGVPAGSERYRAGKLPVWIDFGERVFYGIPDLDGSGFKVADDTRGVEIDPTSFERAPTEESLARARGLIAQRFPELAKAPLIRSEVCQYENSPEGHLLIDRHPAAKNVWLAGGGSGHGFKLSPAVGEMLASAIVDGKKTPEMFRIGKRAEAAKQTQFDS